MRIHYIVAWGERKSLEEWAKDSRCRVSYDLLVQRFKYGRGISPEDMIGKADLSLDPHDIMRGPRGGRR